MYLMVGVRVGGDRRASYRSSSTMLQFRSQPGLCESLSQKAKPKQDNNSNNKKAAEKAQQLSVRTALCGHLYSRVCIAGTYTLDVLDPGTGVMYRWL